MGAQWTPDITFPGAKRETEGEIETRRDDSARAGLRPGARPSRVQASGINVQPYTRDSLMVGRQAYARAYACMYAHGQEEPGLTCLPESRRGGGDSSPRNAHNIA